MFGGDPSHRILEVSDLFVQGEIALQKEERDQAAKLLERAVEVEDALSYGEPPQRLQPTRHTSVAVYLKSGRFEEAERVSRGDLGNWRKTGWSLHGLRRALGAQGKTAEAREVASRHAVAWARADRPATTSCKCIPSPQARRGRCRPGVSSV